MSRLAVVGGGPAGLMAAEVARAAGLEVDLFDAKGSVGRKFLIAGKGGLNLTHSEPMPMFVRRYREREGEIAAWLRGFDADALREWARGLGVETFVGTSGRVFPTDLKAAPLLRGWVRRLRDQGVRFHVHHRWLGWGENTTSEEACRSSGSRERSALRFATPDGDTTIHADAAVFALGGGSWPQLGSDGSWQDAMRGRGVDVAPLRPANCGFDIGWSEHFAKRHAGAPLKPVVAHWRDAAGTEHAQQGECVVTQTGVEGSLVYALSAGLRDAIARDGSALLHLDIAPGREQARLCDALARPRAGRSLSEHIRRQARLSGAKAGLLREVLDREAMEDPAILAATIKRLPLVLKSARPIEEAISSAGGVRLEALDEALMLAPGAHSVPTGTFFAGEMLDWEAPTGGYLLTACLASGRRAGEGAVAWLASRGAEATPGDQ